MGKERRRVHRTTPSCVFCAHCRFRFTSEWVFPSLLPPPAVDLRLLLKISGCTPSNLRRLAAVLLCVMAERSRVRTEGAVPKIEYAAVVPTVDDTYKDVFGRTFPNVLDAPATVDLASNSAPLDAKWDLCVPPRPAAFSKFFRTGRDLSTAPPVYVTTYLITSLCCGASCPHRPTFAVGTGSCPAARRRAGPSGHAASVPHPQRPAGDAPPVYTPQGVLPDESERPLYVRSRRATVHRRAGV